MIRYTKVINGVPVSKCANEINIVKDGKLWLNPTHSMLVDDGWEREKMHTYTEDEIVSKMKAKLRSSIKAYDSSSHVNIFYINGLPVWLDKATRAGLMLRFQSELALKKEVTTLWYNGMSFELQLNSAMQMLYAIENYASQCYDNTQMHLSQVDSLSTQDEIKAYDYKIGYPEKLRF